MNKATRAAWHGAVVLAMLALLAGCDDRYEVLEQQELDLAPVLVQTSGVVGYEQSDVLAVLIPAPHGVVRLGRDIAQVMAVAKSGSDKWTSLAPEQAKQLRSLDYTFSSPIGLALENPRVLGPALGGKSEITDERNKAIWVRAGSTGARINIEVGFDTQPLTIRKVSYVAAADGFSVDLESGATLKVRKKKF